MRLGWLILGLLSSSAIADMTPTDAFKDGNAFAKSKDGIGMAKSKISTAIATDATKGVPNYTATDPASGYYMGGVGSLTAPATAGVTNCTSTPGTTDPDGYTHGKCEATRMLMKDPGKKDVMFPLNKKTDPLVVTRNTVAADADTYLGTLIVGGAYSGCADKTVKDPDKFETETCNQYLAPEPNQTCNEVLTVAITVTESCVPGTWYGAQLFGIPYKGWEMQIDAFCDMTRTDGKLALRFTPVGLHGICSIGYLDVPKTLFTVTDVVNYGVVKTVCDDEGYCADKYGFMNDEVVAAHNYKGSCTVKNHIGYEPGYTQGCVGGTCNYTFRMVDSRWLNTAVGGSGSLPEPGLIITETDNWDNQCSALDARLP
jgi:hypothetical protein